MTSKFGYVVICGAVPSMVRSVRLYNQCSHQYVNIHRNGTVMARSNDKDATLTLSSDGPDLRLLIHSPKEDMFLCFNRRWKLIGRRITRQEALKQHHCLFLESMIGGYNQYASVANSSFYIGFNNRGLQLRRPMALFPWKRQHCFRFMKENSAFSINMHNSIVAGELIPPPPPPRRTERPQRFHHNRHPRPRLNSIETKTKRHRHRHTLTRKGGEIT